MIRDKLRGLSIGYGFISVFILYKLNDVYSRMSAVTGNYAIINHIIS